MNKLTIGKVCKFVGGSQPPKSVFIYEEQVGYIRLVQTRDYKSDSFKTFIPEDSTQKFCTENDIMIGRYGPPVFQILRGISGAYNVALMKAIPKSKILNEYLYYFLCQEELFKYIEKLSLRTGGQTGVDLFSLREYPILLPNLKHQQVIVDVLGSLDQKIELNNQINAELEGLAKLVYDYWFVQFDFPDANGRPYKASGGKMIYNEVLKRAIPESWRDGVLSDIANITMGQSPSGSSYNANKNGTVFYQGSTDFGWRFPTIRQYTTEPSRMAQEDDILLSVRAPVGTLNQAMEDCCIGRGLAALREKDGSKSYLWSLMEYFKQIFDRRNTSGTTFGSITKIDLFGLKVQIPPSELIAAFKKIVDPFHEKIKINSKENQEISSLRDWLLPMLMNGQVSVGKSKPKSRLNYDEVEEDLGMVAENEPVYGKEEKLEDLFPTLNYDFELAAVVLLTEQRFNCNYGKKYFHKMFSNMQFLASLPKINELQFAEKGWGMFSKGLAKSIDQEVYIQKSTLENAYSVYKVKSNYYKVVTNWINNTQNKLFVSEVNAMLSVYEKPLIKGSMDRIELLNTVLECIKVLGTYKFPLIYNKMKTWKMEEPEFEYKANKFKPAETMHMVALVRELKMGL